LTTWLVPARFDPGGGPGVAGDTGTSGACGKTSELDGFGCGTIGGGEGGGTCATAALKSDSSATAAMHRSIANIVAFLRRIVPSGELFAALQYSRKRKTLANSQEFLSAFVAEDSSTGPVVDQVSSCRRHRSHLGSAAKGGNRQEKAMAKQTGTFARSRLTTFDKNICPQCSSWLLAPEWSEHVSEHNVRHSWTCHACGYGFETSVFFPHVESAAA
jgi:hypothetical protein